MACVGLYVRHTYRLNTSMHIGRGHCLVSMLANVTGGGTFDECQRRLGFALASLDHTILAHRQRTGYLQKTRTPATNLGLYVPRAESAVMKQKKIQLSLGWAHRNPYIQRPTAGHKKKALSHSNCSPLHAIATLLYRTLQSTLRYDTVIWRTWMMVAGKNFACKIAAKPLQIETWLAL